MKLGLSLNSFSWPVPAAEIGTTVSRIARTADEAGVDSLWTMDHFFQIPIIGEPPEAPMLEGYATLAYIAGQTRRIRLGTAVTSVSYRHPGVLIKAVTSLDVLSGGRMALGVGAGAPFDAPPEGVDPRDLETVGLGIPFPTLAERFERLEELLQIAHQMWRGDERPYEGAHYRLARPLNSPNTLQNPHPPILVGGSGERKTLRLVARYADMCNLFDLPGSGFQDNLGRKLDVLRAHCDEVGRDYDEIEKTTAGLLDLGENRQQGLASLLDHLRGLAAIGIDHVILGPRGPLDDATLEAVASIVPEVHGIPTGAERSRSG
jgi:F420-dependent oxidoreductase-like protein